MKTLTKDMYLNDDEITSLLDTLRLVRNERDSLLIELALRSGAREGELLKLTKADLDVKARSIFISDPEKGSSKREVPLDLPIYAHETNFFERLKVYSKKMDGLLFPISDSRVRQIWMSIRPVNKKFHALRHTFARYVYSRKKDIRITQYLLGHKSISNTMIYTTIDYDAASIRKQFGEAI